jgi:hypothetical protein
MKLKEFCSRQDLIDSIEKAMVNNNCYKYWARNGSRFDAQFYAICIANSILK